LSAWRTSTRGFGCFAERQSDAGSAVKDYRIDSGWATQCLDESLSLCSGVVGGGQAAEQRRELVATDAFREVTGA
jgi:hypothetical protein